MHHLPPAPQPEAAAAAQPAPLSDPTALRLVGDIGGTHARFALVRGPQGRPAAQHTLSTGAYPDLASAVAAYLQAVGARPVEAAIAIACAIEGDELRMTNNRWQFSVEATRRRLGLQRLLMLNDWEAMAYAVPAFQPPDLLHLGGGAPVAGAPCALLGPGTGLGVSSLVRSRGGEWVAIAGEGGHVSVAPGNEREADILRVLWTEHAHVSAERLVSGMGLENLYRAIARLDGVAPQPLAAAEVCARALARADAQCEEALLSFCSLLGNVAGNLALTLGARGGVYFGGGILGRIGADYLLERSPLRRSFEAKGRFAPYLQRVPTYLIRAEQPALLGAAIALGVQPGEAGPDKD
ncbi:glucokinase [Azohydromonas caseinilytica]|uniref:Glucokinase n=1 Tax=Azohydromonas caseinilytica TaxID=2728836 RepID=A0A848FHL8_9BURK|nr:glucokinase [Azohydromonas caseinilytica]NML17753.1 glucokinase [Azohydromonas caseinilytica]